MKDRQIQLLKLWVIMCIYVDFYGSEYYLFCIKHKKIPVGEEKENVMADNCA
jgi:hypothetical protein